MIRATRLTNVVLWFSAFALSMVLYLFVQAQIGPNQSVSISIPVSANNTLNSKLVFDEEGTSVPFTATGPRDKLDALETRLKDNPRYVIAVADLGAITPESIGSKSFAGNVPLKVIRPPDDPGSIAYKQDRVFEAHVERPATKGREISIMSSPSDEKGGLTPVDRRDFELNPSVVILSGPASQVEDAVPMVVINPDDVESTGVTQANLTISSKSAAPLPNLTNPRVETVEVRPTHLKRALYVNVNFLGHVAPGYRVANYYVRTAGGPSSTVMVRGPGGVVAKASTLDVTVDISGLQESKTFEVRPKLPPRVELLEPPLKLSVDIEKIRR